MQQISQSQLDSYVGDMYTQEQVDYLDGYICQTYGIDVNSVPVEERTILRDFADQGSATAMMRFLARIKSRQELDFRDEA